MASTTLTTFQPEILAPAGNLAKCRVAFKYGADAVYLAGPKFGLRQGADNLDLEEMKSAVNLAKTYKAKVYLVLNSFLFSEEVDELKAWLPEFEKTGVDAVIASDLGVIETVLCETKLAVHVSTQACVHNTYAAKFWKSLGCSRVILARETSVLHGSQIRQEADIEVEMFVHGAMCMAYSGRCTISNFTAGRDSNRGGCEHSCRWNYSLRDDTNFLGEKPFFSSKDMFGLYALPQMLEAEIDSFKIEGRMKGHLYLASVISAYRQGLRGDWEKAENLLKGFPHRPYTDQPFSGQFDSSSAASSGQTREGSHNLAATCLTRDGSRVLCQSKGPFQEGDALEGLGFDGELFNLGEITFWDVLGNRLHNLKPNQCFYVEHPKLEADMVIRMPYA